MEQQAHNINLKMDRDIINTDNSNCPKSLGELPLSKNAQKRLLKQERYKATRDEWKTRTKEKRKLKSELKRQQSALEDIQDEGKKMPIAQKPPCGEILIDLAFEGLMNQKELKSLVSQICRCYSINRRTANPFRLVVTGLNGGGGGGTEELLEKTFPDYKRWQVDFQKDPLESYKTDKEILYLSPDAKETIMDVDSDSTFVIGGLIDRNRHKNAAAVRAKALNIKAVKLPLAEHVKLNSAKVLTIVHVFDLLCKQRELQSWPEAINAIIPSRKRSQQ